MSDSSGFSNISSGGRASEPPRQSSSGGRPNARLIGVPNELREVRQPVRLNGEVTQSRVDRTTNENIVNVRTPSGEVQLRLPPEQPPPVQNAQVRVEIQPGNPPQSAYIEQAPSAATEGARAGAQSTAQNVNNQPRATQTQINQATTSTAQTTPQQPQQAPRTSATPLSVEVRSQTAGTSSAATISEPITRTPPTTSERITQTAPPPARLGALPQPGALARLQPISAGETARLITQSLPALLSNSLTSAALQNPSGAIIQSATPPSTIIPNAQSAATVSITTSLTSRALTQILSPLNQPIQTALQVDRSGGLAQGAPSSGFVAPQAIAGAPTTLSLQQPQAAQANTLNAFSGLNIAPNTIGAPGAPQPPAQAQSAGSAPLLGTPAPLSGITDSIVPPRLEQIQLGNFAPLPALTIGTNAGTPLQSPLIEVPSLRQPLDVRVNTITPPQIDIVAPGSAVPLALNASMPAILSESTAPRILQTPPLSQTQIPLALSGTIIGSTTNNFPILSVFLPQTSSIQNFTLQIPSEAALLGTQIEFIPQTSLIAPAALGAETPPLSQPLSAFLQPQPWQVLEQLYQTLAQHAPQTAQAFSTLLPNTAQPAQVTPAALFFIAAIRSGDISSWLGDKATEALKRSSRGGSILSRLGQEAGLLSRSGAEPVSQDWRAISLPFFHQGEIQRIGLYYKQDQQDESDGVASGTNTRFIFDLNLDQMGQVQIDGLFKASRPDARRLDLVVRTEQSISGAMQHDMRQTYLGALQQADTTGDLSFQDQNDGWVKINIEDEKRLGVDI